MTAHDTLHGRLQLHGAADGPTVVDWLRDDPAADPTVVVRLGASGDALGLTLFFDDPAACEAWASSIVEQARVLRVGAEIEAMAT